jgi:outer membrane protein OmpA-like peptidoglycan-associated protein
LVGIVDRVSGVRIVVQRTGASEADQHFIPLSWVASVTDRVTLDCPAADARAPSATRIESRNRRAIGPIVWAGVGVAAVAMVYGAVHLIPRTAPDVASTPRPSPSPTARSSSESTASARPPAPKAIATPAVPLAQPATVADFLNSNTPVPYRFSLDSVSFAPGSATLDATASKAIAGIAGVMTTHLNTQIKLAIAPQGGALAMRRAAAIRAALMARGVAAYRIAVGPSRDRSHASKSGIDLVILAK